MPRASLLLLAWLVLACSKPQDQRAAPSASTEPPPPRPPPPARKLVQADEKPPLAWLVMANPIAIVAKVGAVDSVPRCDCSKARLDIERILRNESTLNLDPGKELILSLPGDELDQLLGQSRLWILRPEPEAERIAALEHRSASEAPAVPAALRELALSYEREDGPLPSLALVTTTGGQVVWHRGGRVSAVGELNAAERQAQKRIVDGFQALSASQHPTPALARQNAWWLRIFGQGAEGDVAKAHTAVEGFATALARRFEPARTISQSVAVVRAAPAGPDAGSSVIVQRVLKGSLSEKAQLELVSATIDAPQILLLGTLADGRASVLRAYPLDQEADLASIIAEQKRYHLGLR